MADEKRNARKDELEETRAEYARLVTVLNEVNRDMPNTPDKADVLARISSDVHGTEQKLEQEEQNSLGYGY